MRLLRHFYRATGWLAMFFFAGILVLVLANVLGRQIGVAFRSADEFAGYCMSASAFLGLAATFRARMHVRVTLLSDSLDPLWKQRLELACLAVAVVLLSYLCWHVCFMTYESWDFDEKTPGLLPLPLWLPQSGMAIGLFAFLLSFIEALWLCARGIPDQAYDSVEAPIKAE